MANAENAMYKDKTINRSSINKDIVDTIIQTLHKRSRYEQLHSINVQNLSAELGKALNMPETELVKLKRAAYLHDIGKIVLDYSLLNKNALDIEEQEKFKQHSVVGYRILNLIDETLDLAEYVYSHHEKWDGKGYPRGLKGEQIPLISRIISLTETYDRVYRRTIKETENYKQVSLEIIKEAAGSQFDPELTSLFLEIAENIELQA
jgi:putative nucleotidyltransferase with HDIG domain